MKKHEKNTMMGMKNNGNNLKYTMNKEFNEIIRLHEIM